MRHVLSAAALVVLAVLGAGCGSHSFAGMPREQARRLAVADARGWQIFTEDLADFGYAPRAFRVVGTFRARNGTPYPVAPPGSGP